MPQETLLPESGEKLPQNRTIVLVALGSNRSSEEGTPAEVVEKGIAALAKCFEVIRSRSPLYQTPAFPPGSGADYINAAVCIETDHSPQAVIKLLHDIEAQMGRTRKKRWGDRTLDLDLIGVGDIVLPDAETHAIWRALPLSEQMIRAPDLLILPHPRVQERAFVLVPLADVAPDWEHPALGLSVTDMLAALPEALKQEVVAL
ncbi:2-amino-4-hydroxy-6-hydroxymethyldihydropteridine diphosphokinase [uncultured Roseobacter sp.]|uniref:2-amino-4-hydroxy-6- hydroxymethyldihydropteridine diphosphokinase n=1 Tax=uncultured Roseobacter sp. TaxID=114847 RepID=UPI0026126C69|nr:2-amino-4-hydroxy-6-hydroxymethyldihydropteridine diphosphokinase [uncultured Roseobacter sp.]